MDLVGAAEIATLLGVTRQRVHQLAAEPGFPEPAMVLSAGKFWDRREVEQWGVANGRLVRENGEER